MISLVTEDGPIKEDRPGLPFPLISKFSTPVRLPCFAAIDPTKKSFFVMLFPVFAAIRPRSVCTYTCNC